MNRTKCALSVVAFLAVNVAVTRADSNGFAYFAVGNSLTQNSDFRVVDDIATLNGINVNTTTTGNNIRAGQGLDNLWRVHTGITGTPYTTALSNAYNAVTLEPYLGPGLVKPQTNPSIPDQGDTGDINRAIDFMNYSTGAMNAIPPVVTPSGNAANVNAQFYIFARWTEQNAWDTAATPITYDAAWNKPYDPLDTSFFSTETASYFNSLIPAIRLAQPSNMKPIELIPTGFVLDAIDKQLRSEPEMSDDVGVDPINRLDTFFYGGDELHATAPYGELIATLTFYATLFHTSPVGVALPPGDFTNLILSNAQTQFRINEFENIIWDTVQNTPFTGVPEPTSLAIVGIAGLFVMRHRR